jgi:hypothetical protein
VLKEFGITTGDLMPATKATLWFSVPAAVIVVGVAGYRGTLIPH